jgi:hypothetical protein
MKRLYIIFSLLYVLLNIQAKTYYFSSYNLYTCEEDKYLQSGHQKTFAKVSIDEKKKTVLLSLYDTGNKKWYNFPLTIKSKAVLGKGIIAYNIINNVYAEGRSYVYVSFYRDGGLFIDVSGFNYQGDEISVWMQGPYKIE